MAFFEEQRLLLMESLRANRLAQSMIFIGDQSDEDIHRLVQGIFCKQDHSICGSCSSCVKFASGNLADYLEILPDGASVKNHQIEDAQNFVVIKPFEENQKVILVRQADLMTEQAQNRLLKVLEEPPEYALFIFETQNGDSILDTIKSRSQIFTIANAPISESQIEGVERAQDFIHALYTNDFGTVLDMGVFAKKEKESFLIFLDQLIMLFTEVLHYKETGDLDFVNKSNQKFFNEREHLGKIIHKLNSKKIIQWILLIDDLQIKIKNNRNYELSVDQWLFNCLK